MAHCIVVSKINWSSLIVMVNIFSCGTSVMHFFTLKLKGWLWTYAKDLKSLASINSTWFLLPNFFFMLCTLKQRNGFIERKKKTSSVRSNNKLISVEISPLRYHFIFKYVNICPTWQTMILTITVLLSCGSPWFSMNRNIVCCDSYAVYSNGNWIQMAK